MGLWEENAATLTSFFAELNEARCAATALVTMDMSEACITAVTQYLLNAQVVFDRFHVQQLVNEALDETRRQEWRPLRQLDEKHAIKGQEPSIVVADKPFAPNRAYGFHSTSAPTWIHQAYATPAQPAKVTHMNFRRAQK